MPQNCKASNSSESNPFTTLWVHSFRSTCNTCIYLYFSAALYRISSKYMEQTQAINTITIRIKSTKHIWGMNMWLCVLSTTYLKTFTMSFSKIIIIKVSSSSSEMLTNRDIVIDNAEMPTPPHVTLHVSERVLNKQKQTIGSLNNMQYLIVVQCEYKGLYE